MLGLPSLKIESTDPGIIPCDGGSLSTSGGTGNFNFRAITVGEGIGFVDTTWNAIGQIDRFQIIWNNQIVADSLFVGDSLSSGASGQISDLATSLSNGFQENNWNDQTQTFDSTGNTVYPNINPYPSTACLWEGGVNGTDDRIVYNIAPTGSLYDRNDNSGQTPSGTGGNAPSQGTYENAQSSPLADPASGCPASSYKQIGVVADYPNANSKSWDGNIKLQFYKDAQFPEIIELAAKNRAPQTLVRYLRDLVSDFHSSYNAHKVLVDDVDLRDARLTLYAAIKCVVANGLTILGVSAPEKM